MSEAASLIPKSSYATFSKLQQLHPERQATWYSKLLLTWCQPLVKLGYERQLQEEDIWPLTDEKKCAHCSTLLVSHWSESHSIFKAIGRTYGFPYARLGMILFGSYAFDLFGPVVLHIVVDLIQTEAPVKYIWFWLIGLMITRVIKSVLMGQFYYLNQVLFLQITSALKGFVYEKALKLNGKSRAEKSTAEIVNLYTTDIKNLIQAAYSFHYIWILPVIIGVILFMLYSVLGYATFAGLATIIVVLVLNNILAVFQSKAFDGIMSAKDSRMKVVNEIFSSIQIVKLNAWDERFSKKLQGARKTELSWIWYDMKITGVSIVLLWGAPVLVSIATFGVYAGIMHHTLTASKVFTAIALFRQIQEPLRTLPEFITEFIQAGVSLKRFNEFSGLEERNPDNVIQTSGTSSDKVVVEIEDGEFAWDAESTSSVFHNIQLSVSRGEFVVVHGKVGTGKSSFCSVLLGDMIKRSGKVQIHGSIAYCPQQAWIQNMTVRDNILFGKPFDAIKYQKVIEACGLVKDLKEMKGGDLTEIGERGLNVSGGQKARISLARACYSDADIFLFDSPLAAVDAIVQNEIFTKCLLGLLRHKTRILITHNPEIIASPLVDRTIELGNLEFTDTFNQQKMPLDAALVSPLPCRYSSTLQLPEASPVLVENRSSITSLDETLPKLTKRINSYIGHEDGKLVDDEVRQEGQVSKEVFSAYFKAVGGFRVIVLLISVQIIWQVLQIGSDFWLTHWTTQSDDTQGKDVVSNITIYAVLALSSAFMVLIRTLTCSYCGLKGSKNMFNEMTTSLIHAPMSFFDANPIGRILNRFSDDISNIDLSLPFGYGTFLAQVFSIGATLLTAAIVTRFMGFFLLPILYLYIKLGGYYLKTQRELTRLMKVTKSPMLSHISESVDGVHVIRAFGSEQLKRFIQTNQRVIDKNNESQFAAFVISQWFAMRMQLMGGAILLIITASLALMRDYLSAGIIGLAFNYGLSVDQGLESLIQVWSWLETSMISPERVQEYIDIPSEAPQVIESTEPKASWPENGKIQFDHVSFRYKVGGDLVLKDLDFVIEPQEKIGIVGRTGAGKSSLTMALFRINELAGGTIWIDGVDSSKLGLRVLRERLSIITQTPVLFKGTLRGYLDPFDDYSDEALWNSLRKVNLADDIGKMELKLLAPLEENGENFSVGERQLLCMARALLSNAKIVIMDEATAAIDSKTDALIQQVIRREFNNSTLITIAHRLDTVLDADKIMVLSQGTIVEFDSPKALIQKGKGHLYDLAKEGGYLERLNF